jgi:iron complex outermembrane recepter protein
MDYSVSNTRVRARGFDIRYWDPYDAHSTDFAPSLLGKPNGRGSLSLKYENFSKREDPQVMQKTGWPGPSGVVATPSDPNLSGVGVSGLPNEFSLAFTTRF